MATLPFLTELTAAPLRKISFQPRRCLRRRLNSCGCSSCSDSCTAGAIVISDKRVHFNPEACTGCMRCSVSCPNDAFEFAGLDLEEGLQTLPAHGNIVLSCGRQTQVHGDEYVLPCVGALSLEHLLALGLERSAQIIINMSACTSCENRLAADHFRNLLSIVRDSGAGRIKAEFVIVTEPENLFSIGSENRRAFLTSLRNNLISVVASQLPAASGHAADDSRANRRVPKKIKLVREMLQNLEQEQADLVSSLCLHHIQVSDACTACPLCKGICPTGAIRVGMTGKEKSLTIDNTLCSGCGLCAEFCRHGAIELHKSKNSDNHVLTRRDTKPLACANRF